MFSEKLEVQSVGKGIGLFQVKTDHGSGWFNFWDQCIDGLTVEHVFNSPEEAEAEIYRHLKNVQEDHLEDGNTDFIIENEKDAFEIFELKSLNEVSNACALVSVLNKVEDKKVFERYEIKEETKRHVRFLVAKAYVEQIDGSSDCLNSICEDAPNFHFLLAVKYLETIRHLKPIKDMLYSYDLGLEKRVYPNIVAMLSLALL